MVDRSEEIERKSSLQRRRRRRRRCGWELHCTAVAAAESIRENADLRKRDLKAKSKSNHLVRSSSTSTERRDDAPPASFWTGGTTERSGNQSRDAVVTLTAASPPRAHRLRLILNRNRDGTDIITLHSSVASVVDRIDHSGNCRLSASIGRSKKPASSELSAVEYGHVEVHSRY